MTKTRIFTTLSNDFKDGLAKRYDKYFRFDNNKYWQKYYAEKFRSKNVEREKTYSDIIFNYVGKKAMVVDVGAGIGFLAMELGKKDLKVYAVDLFDEMIKRARKYLKNSQVKIIKADIVKLPFKRQSIDCIVSISLIEHLAESEVREDVLPGLHRIIKAKKYLFIHVPVKTPLSRFYKFWRKYILRDLPDWAIDDDGDVTHKMWKTAAEYVEMVEEAGFELVNLDYRLVRSHLKPRIFSDFFSIVQRVTNFTDPKFNNSLHKSSIWIRIAKRFKSNFAVTAYFLFRRKT